MNKSIILVFLVLVSCVYGLHMQKYAPSTPGGTYNTNTNTNTGGSGALINGQAYYYTGPFTLACWLPSNTQKPYRWDTCYNEVGCQQMLTDYRQCQGVVKKYPPISA